MSPALIDTSHASVLSAGLRIVHPASKFMKVSLTRPSTSSFIHVAAEVDARPAFLPNSRQKKEMIAKCRHHCAALKLLPGVKDASTFEVLLVPPGRGEFLKRTTAGVHVARYDVAILIECEDEVTRQKVQSHFEFGALMEVVRAASRFVHSITASNIRRIGPVDHSRQGVFLFNYFHADSLEKNLRVWDYTAGWFQAETGLDNSTVLLPDVDSRSEYTILNHCRWDSLWQILPSLVFKRSFRRYVLDNFAINNVAAMPVLYRLA